MLAARPNPCCRRRRRPQANLVDVARRVSQANKKTSRSTAATSRPMGYAWPRPAEVRSPIQSRAASLNAERQETDGHVRIWSTEPIRNANDKTYTKPRQLCHMSHHLGTIHSVRFSPNNRYLASGADDKIICIYQLDKNPPSHTATFGNSTRRAPESRGHPRTDWRCRNKRAATGGKLEDTQAPRRA